MSTSHLIALFVTVPLCLSLSDTEVIPCHAGDDTCPPGSYCSTVTHRCWTCQLCGNIDLLFNWIPKKCLCDGGSNGDPFAICSIYPPPGEKRNLIIRRYDDILPELSRHKVFFDGTRREEVCPKHHTTSAIRPTSELSDLTTEVTHNEIISTEAKFHKVSEGTVTNITSKQDTGIIFTTSDMQDWDLRSRRDSLIVMMLVFISLLVVIVLVVVYRCHCTRGRNHTADKNQVSTPLQPSTQTRHIDEVTENYEILIRTANALPSKERLKEVDWANLKSPLNSLLQDVTFKKKYVTAWLKLSPQKDTGYEKTVDRVCLYHGDDLTASLRGATEIFEVNNYDALKSTLMDCSIQNEIHKLNLQVQREDIFRLLNIPASVTSDTQAGSSSGVNRDSKV